MTKTFVLVIGHRGRARKTSDGVFLPVYYIVGRRQKRSWECGQSFFRRALVLKAQKLEFSRLFWLSVGASRGLRTASSDLKKHTKRHPAKYRVSYCFNLFP